MDNILLDAISSGLKYVLFSRLSFDKSNSVAFLSDWSGLKVDLSSKKKNMLSAKKHKLFVNRVIHFWIRIWSGRDNGLRVGIEKWEDGNTSNDDGCKNPGSDGEISNKSMLCLAL